jgi:Fe-Mn family superoxide dismutase
MNNIFVPNNYIKLSSIKISNDIEKAFKKNNGFEIKLEFNDLPYGENALSKSIDEETMTLHHDKHHKKYFDNFMDALSEEKIDNLSVNDVLSNLEKYPKSIREKLRNNGGGHFNHEFFWNLMSPKPQSKPKGALLGLIEKDFKSFENFKSEFVQTGLDRFGSGWVWLCINDGQLKLSSMPNQDNPLIEKCGIPLIGCDVWEHAYYLKYKNDRESYLNAWFDVVNWAFPEKILGEL